MDVITIGNITYYSIDRFMLMNNISSKKTVYNWVKDGKAEQKKIYNTSFFKMK